MLFALIVGPLVASIVLWIVDSVVGGPLLSGILPSPLGNMVYSLRTTITVAIVLSTVVPKLLAQIDTFFNIPDDPADQKED